MAEEDPYNFEDLAYDSDYDSGFGTKSIVIDGDERLVHNTNNLPVLFGAYMLLKNADQPRNSREELYYHILKDNNHNLQSLLAVFERQYGQIFYEVEMIDSRQQNEIGERRLVEAAFNQGQIPTLDQTGRGLIAEEEQDRRDYHYSQMFVALADIALEQEPDYDLSLFCR
jgi:hypothetical protein